MNAETKNKEAIYDEQIQPLMTQIIEICQTNGIAMVASFEIPTPDVPDLRATTNLPSADHRYPPEHLIFCKLIGAF